MLVDIPNFPKHKFDTDRLEVFSKYSNNYLKKLISKKGYYYYAIQANGKKHTPFLHRLVYEIVKGPIPEGYVVHHIDENKRNNNPDNLIAMPFSQHTSMHKQGSKHSVESRIKMSESQKKIPHSISPEQRKMMAERHRGKKHKPSVHLPQRKPVLMFDKEMHLIKEYSFVNETAKDGFYPALVSLCCQRTRKTHKGYIFRYKSGLPNYCN